MKRSQSPELMEREGLTGHADAIEKIAGHRPYTCPWRSLSDPLISEVARAYWAVETGNLSAVIGADPPAVLAEAIGTYRAAATAVDNEERRIRDAEKKRE